MSMFFKFIGSSRTTEEEDIMMKMSACAARKQKWLRTAKEV